MDWWVTLLSVMLNSPRICVCALASVYPNLSVQTDLSSLWITKVSSVQNTASVQTFAQSQNLLRRLAEYKLGPHVFSH